MTEVLKILLDTSIRPTLAESLKQWCKRHKARACVPHTPYTSVLKFVPPAGRVCGAVMHAVGGEAGYGLLADFFRQYSQ